MSFFSAKRGNGYGHCFYFMIDKDFAYNSLTKVYRVMKEVGLLQKKADDTNFHSG